MYFTPNGCKFCDVKLLAGRRFPERSVTKAVDEMEDIQRDSGLRGGWTWMELLICTGALRCKNLGNFLQLMFNPTCFSASRRKEVYH
jgi:hypothetical protein